MSQQIVIVSIEKMSLQDCAVLMAGCRDEGEPVSRVKVYPR